MSRSYTKKDVSTHNTRKDCWIIIKDKVKKAIYHFTSSVLPALNKEIENCLDFLSYDSSVFLLSRFMMSLHTWKSTQVVMPS
jgi:hypothetical protein